MGDDEWRIRQPGADVSADSATQPGGALLGGCIQSGPPPSLPVLHTLTTRPHIVIFTGGGSIVTLPIVSYLRPMAANPSGWETERNWARNQLQIAIYKIFPPGCYDDMDSLAG